MLTCKKVAGVLFVLLGVTAALIIVGFSRNKVSTEMLSDYKERALGDVSPAKWDELAQKKIFFGHMSVGNNIMGGMRAILDENSNIPITISDHDGPQSFIHVLLGGNTKPFEKFTAFQSQVSQLQQPPDIAFLKLCYIDIKASTDVAMLFDAYQKMIAQLQAAFPDTIFMHCTVPLKSVPLSAKGKMKELIKPFVGKSTVVENNSRRAEFSNLLKQTYRPERIIDIAHAESTTPQGKQSFKMKKGRKVPFLLQEYTVDGGHLNDVGSRRVAEQILLSLGHAE